MIQIIAIFFFITECNAQNDKIEFKLRIDYNTKSNLEHTISVIKERSGQIGEVTKMTMIDSIDNSCLFHIVLDEIGNVNEETITQILEAKGNFICWKLSEELWSNWILKLDELLRDDSIHNNSSMLFDNLFLSAGVISEFNGIAGWSQPSDTAHINEFLNSSEAHIVFPKIAVKYIWSNEAQLVDIVRIGYYNEYDQIKEKMKKGEVDAFYRKVNDATTFNELAKYEATGFLEDGSEFDVTANSLEELKYLVDKELLKKSSVQETGEKISVRKYFYGHALYFLDASSMITFDVDHVEAPYYNEENYKYTGKSIWQTNIHFTEQGKTKWSDLTEEQMEKVIVIGIDNKIYSAPYIRSKLTNGKTSLISENKATAIAIQNILSSKPIYGDVKLMDFKFK